MEFQFFEEQIFFATTMIQALDPVTQKGSVGTGFLVNSPIPGEDNSVVCLVTCKHVLFGPSGVVSFKLHVCNPAQPQIPDLQNPLVLNLTNYADAYHEHPDSDVDVAVLNISELWHKHSNLYAKHIGAEKFADMSAARIGPTMHAVFVGYPLGLHDQAHSLPILRTGPIATLPKIDFNGKPVFLIDAEVFPGTSGSPVFVDIEGRYQLVGLVAAAFEQTTDVITVTHQPRQAVRQGIGLGVVFKIDTIVDVLDLVVAKVKNK